MGSQRATHPGCPPAATPPTEGIVRDRKIVTEEHHVDLKVSEGTGIATILEVPSAAIQKYTSVFPTPTGSPLGHFE